MPASGTLAPSTHTAIDTEQLGLVYDMLIADETLDPAPRHYLVDSAKDHFVELPEEVYQVLRRVVGAMQQGLSVTISPTSQTLTTQQAADLLGISRPTLIKAVKDNKLPHTLSGTHRRLALTDVLDYREKRRREQYAAIEALAVDVDETTDIDQTLADLKAARKELAEKRRSSPER